MILVITLLLLILGLKTLGTKIVHTSGKIYDLGGRTISISGVENVGHYF